MTSVAVHEQSEPSQIKFSKKGGRRGSSRPPIPKIFIQDETQNQAPINSSFDDLVEAGTSPQAPRAPIERTVAIVPARRRTGEQRHIPGRHPGPPGVTKIGFQDETEEGSEISESDLSITAAGPRVSLNPAANRSKSKNGRKSKVRVSTSKSEEEEEDDEDDELSQLKPLAARRKGSVAPIRITNSNFNHSTPTGNSNGTGSKLDSEKGSPTPSATSISSLIREKLGQVPIPGMFRNKKPREYKLQAFVSILFLTIIVLVGSIYIIHKEKELQKSYFDRIRFSSKDRRIRVTNILDRVVLSGVLGVNLNFRDKAWSCLMEHQRENETCLEWMGKGRLYLKTRAAPPRRENMGSSVANGNNILCYGIYWESLGRDFTLKDCYDMSENTFFYGGGEGGHWPLNKSVPFAPFLTGNKVDRPGAAFQWGRSLSRFFVNSAGAAIKISEDSPLYTSINHPEKDQICFGAKTDAFSFPQTVSNMPTLNYTICTAENALEISRRLGDKSIYHSLKHDDVQLTYSVAESPIYKIRSDRLNQVNQSDSALLNHTDKIASSKLPTNGFILLDETWQNQIGDLEGDSDRFPNLAETLNITKRRGFRVALTIQPFFSTQSSNYVEGLKQGLWVKERSRDTPFGHLDAGQAAPALTEYKNWNSVAVLDVTKKEARSWLRDKVKEMTDKHGIEILYADMGTCFDLPQYYHYSDPLPSADHGKDLFLQTLRSIPHLRTIGVSTAVKLPKLPTFVSLSPTESSWKGIQSLIPNMLSLGLAGFPFLNPGSIGGDFFSDTINNNDDDENFIHHLDSGIDNDVGESFVDHKNISSEGVVASINETETGAGGNANTTIPINVNVTHSIIASENSMKEEGLDNHNSILLPDKELYIRWLQLAHFLPVVQYSVLPNDYDDEVIKMAQHFEMERRQKIFNFIKKAINEALTTGLPIIRPIWMIDPSDPNCFRVSDEFAIGEDIIVAPILRPNSTERDIYLPKGIWKDELEQSSTKGDRWLHNYKVKLNQIPYFIKLSDTGQGTS